jgi:hypothetical protein
VHCERARARNLLSVRRLAHIRGPGGGEDGKLPASDVDRRELAPLQHVSARVSITSEKNHKRRGIGTSASCSSGIRSRQAYSTQISRIWCRRNLDRVLPDTLKDI